MERDNGLLPEPMIPNELLSVGQRNQKKAGCEKISPPIEYPDTLRDNGLLSEPMIPNELLSVGQRNQKKAGCEKYPPIEYPDTLSYLFTEIENDEGTLFWEGRMIVSKGTVHAMLVVIY
ncbi:hypothetical protein TNCV_1503951 [Trichonephila clavipes]|uniref:Uncharacterized protein n=1 Tax=Trichonephila clavipes TaxID=2585209 RepID=A0A8X6VAB3_TRICX|nr:hypothetical protein TNCV_1503951 [Trichonephila clavipes]